MNGFSLTRENLAFQHEWALDNVTMAAFLKCTRWQEELADAASSCRYHYFCDSTYRGDYPPSVDFFVLSFTIVCYLTTMFFTIMHVKEGPEHNGHLIRQPRGRCLLASGPVLLPFILLVLSNGHRINTAFPLSLMGPVLLQLVHVSALAFENKAERCVRYALLESSTASGILHAGLYLDSVILPYYTGLDALARSSFSGECATCVCREEPLVVGGALVSYRAWSATAFCVVGTLCLRLACALFGKDSMCTCIKLVMEGVGWVLLSKDCVYLMVGSSQFGLQELVAHGAVGVLISLHVYRKVCSLLCFLKASRQTRKRRDCYPTTCPMA